MRILGVDPGSIHLGYAVVESKGGQLRSISHGTISAPRSLPLADRLPILYDGLVEVLDQTQPESAGLERVFTALNPASALTLGQARGVVVLALGQRQVELAEYGPGEVKLAVGGHGRSSKDQVARMVGRLLGLPTEELRSDTTDALAIAICHCHGLDRARLVSRAERNR